MAPMVIDDPQALRSLVGQEIGVSEWLVVAQERIAQFAAATEDRQWIHVDRERANRESPYGGTVAHGFLTLSLLSYLMKQALRMREGPQLSVNYGLNRVRFPSAVRAGSRIRARFSLLALKELPDCLDATYSVTVESEGAGKPCCIAEWIIRYYHSSSPAESPRAL